MKSGARWRGLIFRLGAVLFGLAWIGILELVLVMLGWGGQQPASDPFVGFQSVHALFQFDAEAGQYRIADAKQGFFRPDSFSAVKAPNEFRIFCLGGSTVQGRPFSIETSFTTWLELGLLSADSQTQWDVVNCGGVSYASYRLVPILQEVLGYQPNLIIVYTGHNEFLEDRTYGHIKALPQPLGWVYRHLSRLRTYQLVGDALANLRRDSGESDRPIMASEVQAILDYRGGLEKYHRDEKRRQDVIAHYQYNLGRMVQLARAAGVPLLFVNPVSNLRDCPPFKSEHRNDLTAPERDEWERLCALARQQLPTDLRGALHLFEQAMAIDPEHAGLHYTVAKCYDDLGMLSQAEAAYAKARERDVCPLRMVEPMHEALLGVARQRGTPLVDVRQLIQQHTSDGIVGGDLLIDHIHPTIRGHQLIANALTDALIGQGIARPEGDWKTERTRRYRDHFASLEEHYFLKGQERLRGLRGWAEGRAQELPGAGTSSSE